MSADTLSTVLEDVDDEDRGTVVTKKAPIVAEPEPQPKQSMTKQARPEIKSSVSQVTPPSQFGKQQNQPLQRQGTNVSEMIY